MSPPGKTRKAGQCPLEYAWTVTTQAYPKALKVGKKYPKIRVRLIQNMVATALVLLALASVNSVNTLIQFVFPMAFLLFMTVYVTYEHHAGLDEKDPYKATYNITDHWYNFLPATWATTRLTMSNVAPLERTTPVPCRN